MDAFMTVMLLAGGISIVLFTLGVVELVLVKLGFFDEEDQ